MPTADDFRHELFRIMAVAQNSGSKFIEINAGALHRRLGGYPGADTRMQNCCQVMKAQLNVDWGDIVVNEPSIGQGATLTIRYRLPRREQVQREKTNLKLLNVNRARKLKVRFWGSRQSLLVRWLVNSVCKATHFAIAGAHLFRDETDP